MKPSFKDKICLNLSLTVLLALHTSRCSVHDHSAVTELRADISAFIIVPKLSLTVTQFCMAVVFCVIVTHTIRKADLRLDIRRQVFGTEQLRFCVIHLVSSVGGTFFMDARSKRNAS